MYKHSLPLIDANLVESVREFARWQVGGELIERDGLLLVRGSTRYPVMTNAVLRLDATVPPETVLDLARAYFGEHRLGYTVWIRPDIDEDLEAASLAAGFREISAAPWMILDRPLTEDPPPDNFEIREASTVRDILDARDINRQAYASLQMPATEVDAIYGQPHRALGPGRLTLLGYLDGRPVATAMLLLTHAVAGVYWVGTVEDARSRGFAAVMTRTISNAGFAAGAALATLQSSPMGESIYQRLGYVTVGRQKWLLSPKSEKA